jgi:hypothetical protein
MLRRSFPIAVVLALSACNVATSDHPMLGAEPRSSLKLKDGLWLMDDPECTVDVRLPLAQWPGCADWLLIRDGKIAGAPNAKAGELPVEVVVADERPVIVEVPFRELGEKVARLYVYVALEPATFDPLGAVTEAQLWPVACGIEADSSSNQREPVFFPGMNDKCQPASVAVLRAAASAGPQGREKKKARVRWIRASAD